MSSSIIFIGFNQDHQCFSVGTDRGFAIYNCDPLKERFRRDFGQNGGIGIVEMLFRCNILALVGGGKSPKYPPNKVMIWDDYQNKCIAELEFRSEVRAVKLRRERVVVVLENKVYVYNFVNLTLLYQIETFSNPKGLCALSADPDFPSVLACPGLKPGSVHVELNDLKKQQFITAHTNALSQIALNRNGTRLATSSEKGTLIRIFDTDTGQQLRELRRGADRAEIFCIAFNALSTYLVVTSDKGTVHVYGLESTPPHVNSPSAASADHPPALPASASHHSHAAGSPSGGGSAIGGGGAVGNSGGGGGGGGGGGLGPTGGAALPSSGAVGLIGGSPLPGGGNDSTPQNRQSSLSFIPFLPSYFNSEWSFAQFHIPDTRCMCAFGPTPNSVIVVCQNGQFYKYTFDPTKGGEAKQDYAASFY